jgi:teichoic acid transport system permease protein
VSTDEYSDVEYVFEPHSATLPDLREYLAALWDRRQFMVELARSDLRSLRSRTALGNIWSVLDPLFQAGIYFFLYTVIRGGKSGGATAGRAFLPVLIADFFLFSLSMAALNEGGGSIKRGKGLMLNSSFPRALLPVTSVYKSLRRFVPCIFVFVVLFPLAGGKVGSGLFLLPLLFFLQTIMSVGIALVVSTFVTLVPDGNNLISYVSRVLFFVTPVVYPVSLLPAGVKLFISWQPLFSLFASYQAVFSGQVPGAGLVALTALWSGVLLVVGAQVFLRHERQFALHL